MTPPPAEEHGNWPQLRLMLEELCTHVCRFRHVRRGGRPEQVRIEREYDLGRPGAFADMWVRVEGDDPFVLEVKNGYSSETLVRHMKRKYGEVGPAVVGVRVVVLVVDTAGRADWPTVRADLAAALHPSLALEIWDETHFLAQLRDNLGVDADAVTAESLVDIRQAVDRAKGYYAFGGPSADGYDHTPLNAELLWHFGFGKLRRFREETGLGPRDVLAPGLYRGATVLLADMCSFSSYVRDTPDGRIVRECLTRFYSNARHQIINSGGMLYQFVGDEVVGLFGVPDRPAGSESAALSAADALIRIGKSVSHNWQRQLDRVQTSSGLHVGIAVGDLQIVSLRPFGRTHIGAIGDCINVAARLMAAAGPGQIAVSNTFYQALDETGQARFEEVDPVEAKNVGRIKAWTCSKHRPV